jgi:hypothetical protein
VVEQVVVGDRKVEEIVWTPPARPFFERQRECPQGALGTRPLSLVHGISVLRADTYGTIVADS